MADPIWAASIKDRDNWTCQDCGKTKRDVGSANIHAHHIVPLALGGEDTMENGKTLCNNCHYQAHADELSPHAMVEHPDYTPRDKPKGNRFKPAPLVDPADWNGLMGDTIEDFRRIRGWGRTLSRRRE